MFRKVIILLLPCVAVGSSPVPAVTEAPKVPDVVSVTQGWKVMPEAAFPLEVKLVRDVVLKHRKTDYAFTAGTAMIVSQWDGAKLEAVSRQDNCPSFLVALDDTDFKERFAVLYNEWLARYHGKAVLDGSIHAGAPAMESPPRPLDAKEAFEAMNRHLDERRRKKFFDGQGKPRRSDDGTFPLLLENMDSGQVTEIDRSNVMTWHDPVETTREGRRFWVVRVRFKVLTTFGFPYSDADAWISGTRIEKWLYVGSGEVVP